ncbi:hypothetical protein P175DRAFT_0505085 [Aspergillus ochraceoroseus IBT 24754]|uniref:Peptidase A1 domain-containing protein n=2 Tax=Aspergillus ochraceoroseus TaxID=138278 RepID=A0A2T5LM17_9EURO|nr:uncharacterized protein P175DRAFT_0505085 [Aspergillus ochraceoroseus IBT 24754]KKK14673.1 hypothetical protein AOCH_000806 [Aspergillus ochraceoroseus]PTU17319.1 hypothetical protein P175DRAFT_0505085 [Aspergillus ochraceoroseus IBT 24754]
MRLLQCLLTAAHLFSGVTAFVPYSFKFPDVPSDSTDTLERRFVPLNLLSGDRPQDHVDAASGDDTLTLDVRRVPVRRDNRYKVVLADTPTASDTVALNQDGYDFSYFSTVNIGSPGQPVWMMLDTGGANTWVFGADCTATACELHNTFGENSSPTVNMTSNSWSVGYGTGQVSGVLATDNLRIAEIEVRMTFGLVYNASDDFKSYPMDGIIGLGRANDSSMGQPTFMDVVLEQSNLTSNIVSFCLSRSSDGGKDGTVTFGGVDTTKYTGNITYTDIVSTSIHWSIPLDDVSINGVACGFSGKSAIIDTGTSYALVPPDDAKALHALIPGSQAYSDENWIIPCNSTAVVQVTFSGVSYTISPKDYIGSKAESGCVSTIIGRALFGDDVWILGDTYLKNVYSVFDFDHKRIGFAQRSYSPSSTTTSLAATPTDTFASESSSSNTTNTTSATPTSAQHTGTGSASSSFPPIYYWPALAILSMLSL